MSRRRRFALIAAVLLAGAGVAAWLALPRAAEALIAARLDALGLAGARAEVARIGLSGAHLARLEAGDGVLVVRDVDVAWSLAGGIEAITVADATVTGRWTAEGGLDFGPLGPLLEGGDAGAETTPFDLPAERLRLDRATATIDLPQGQLVATLSGTAHRAEPGPALDLTAEVTAPGLTGTATFTGTADGGGAVPMAGTGRLELTADSFAAPGLAGAVDGSVQADLRLGADTLSIAADAPVRVTLADLAPPLRQTLAEHGVAAEPVVVDLTGPGATAGPALTVSGIGDPAGLVLSSDRLAVTATAGAAEARVAAGGTVRLDGVLPTLALRDVAAAVAGVTFDGSPVSGRLEDGSLSLTPEGLTAEASVAAEAQDMTVSGASAARAAFTGRVRLSGQPDLTGALFADSGAVTLDGLRLGEGVAARDPVTLTLLPPAGPLLRLETADDGSRVAAVTAGLQAPSATFETPQGPARIAFAEIALTAAFGTGATQTVAAVTGRDGSLSVAGTDLQAVTLEAGLSEAGPTARLTGRLDTLPGETAELSARSPLRPYRLELAATPAEAEADRLALTAELRDVGNTLLASARGSLALADGSGRATVRVPRQVFDPQGLKPEHLHGLLGTFAHDVTGAVAVDGTIRWDGGGLKPDLKVLLQDVGLTQGFVTLTRINGVLNLTGLDPLRTPKGQQVSVAAIDAGLPLLDAVASFEIARDTLLLDSAQATLAGGTIRARPTAIPLSLDAGEVFLDVEDLRLAPLVDLAGIQGLRARGRLAGTVPLRFAGGDVIIDNAVLRSTRPERVVYAPDDVPAALSGGGQSVDLVLQALQDFRYDDLSLTVDGRASGQMTVKLHIAGANPEFYDGYPVEFNLSVSGELAKAIQAGLSGYRVPDRIRARMEEFTGGQ
ncbi:intermembrane phospholipid transport protein YdbH family protein [Caenispirillum bisanense]|uniref:Dicarboxylate transport n=1 Tax=Caenispirillum bisanense TaxID=414052 RepID=A0A286GP30_9PROT|nr:YdbH domain-containing protein [Caenispirillum bisanense]SOD96724.1 Dicarboxylate transport [Caenispirillum bisanense]